MQQKQDIKGFTVLELIVVITIIAIVSTVGYPNFMNWKTDRELRAAVEKVSSIFALENKCRKIDMDEFLSVNVKSIYQLDIADDQLDKWKNLFKNDEIYFLVFNYREDYEGDDAYIISNDSGFFMTVGKKNEFVYLEQENINLEEEEEEIDDELDFSML